MSLAMQPAGLSTAPDENNLPTEQKNTLLRFLTCGSVDDGKSTLIGRLLYDTGSIYDDQQASLESDSKKFGTTGDDIDFALLVDGLAAEREQGITIDVAYRYFSSTKRSYIIADTPGHEQYTRNMATGASQADLAIILIDARKGVLPQTRRHAFITSLVGIRSVIVAVNKMDLVSYDEIRFKSIVDEFSTLLPALSFEQIVFIPLSAKLGDNLANKSENLSWYDGLTLLDYLDTVSIKNNDTTDKPFRLPVQWVNRPNLDFRGFSGTIGTGKVKSGQEVISLPSGARSVIKDVFGSDGKVTEAASGDAVTVTLTSEIDVSRGDVLVSATDTINASRSFCTDILWMRPIQLSLKDRFLLRIGTATTPMKIISLDYKTDIHSYQKIFDSTLTMNEIGRLTINTEKPIVASNYQDDKTLGAFILIDPYTNETVALGTVASVNDLPEANDKKLKNSDKAIVKEAIELWIHPLSNQNVTAILFGRLLAAILFGLIIYYLTSSFIGTLFVIALDFVLRPFVYQIANRPDKTRVQGLQDGAGI